MKILVTGAGGFIGSHLVEALLNDGHVVIPMIKYSSNVNFGKLDEIIKSGKLDQEDIVIGDITDRSFVRDIVKNVDAVLRGSKIYR